MKSLDQGAPSAEPVRGKANSVTQLSTCSWDTLLLNRRPSSQTAPEVKLWRSAALEPIPLLAEVQKGTMVFPLQSQLSRKVEMILGASPFQMGYPMKTIS